MSFSIALVFKLVVGIAKTVYRDYFWAVIIIWKRSDELRCRQETEGLHLYQINENY